MNSPFPISKDVITIIGSGPAGSVTSFFLSKKKIHHTIIEKAAFPRDKVCGDGLSGKVISVLKKMDPSIIEQMKNDTRQYQASWGVIFSAPNGKKLEIPFKKDLTNEPHPPGFVSKRLDFDNFLLSKTESKYAKRVTGAEVAGLIRSKKGISIQYKLQENEYECLSDLVIGADGDRSITKKSFFQHPLDPGHYYAGIRGYYKGVTGFHPLNFIELHFIPALLPGYFWIFPLPGGEANVGVCVLSSKAGKMKINLRETMLQIIESYPGIKERFVNATPDSKPAGWGLPLGSIKRKLSTDHVLLTGDAASLIDPFTGEGIGNAMVSGMIAAQAAENAIADRNFSAEFLSLQYDNEIERSLGKELQLSYAMQRLCSKPWLFNFIASRSEKNATLRETISCMFEDLDLRSKLRDPKYYLKLLFNY
jgi:geranylgeranyl reductase family protein